MGGESLRLGFSPLVLKFLGLNGLVPENTTQRWRWGLEEAANLTRQADPHHSQYRSRD